MLAVFSDLIAHQRVILMEYGVLLNAKLLLDAKTNPMRYLILLALILAAVPFLGKWQARRFPKRPAAADRDSAPIRTVRCTQCGLVLPEKEAVYMNGQPFCSLEHAKTWQEQHSR